MQELKLHNAEQNKRWEWERIQVRIYKLSIESLILEQSQGIGSRIINNIKNIIITVISAKLVIDGHLTLGMMVAVTFIIGQLNRPLLDLINLVRSLQDTRISLSRINEIHLKDDETNYDSANSEEFKTKIPDDLSITLKSVSFRYNELSKNVLEDTNLVIPHGKVTAIVGSSGSGKTTLIKILMGSYTPTGGEVIIGKKTKLSNIDLKEWRGNFGVVMQEGFLFNDSFMGNIAVGEDVVDMEKVVDAAQKTNIHEFILSTPREYKTKIGNEGLPISTGEKQRILIARAIYRDPKVLFFDEATSSLDANNEKDIMSKLSEFYIGKTVVIIAHRLSTIRRADNIVVLNRGKIVEQGTHEELLNNKQHYHELFHNQLS